MIEQHGIGENAFFTDTGFWDCQCPDDEQYIHAKRRGNYCPRCGTFESDSPDSRVDEIEGMYSRWADTAIFREENMLTKLVELKAGKYWIGDPCYTLGAMQGFDWDEFIREIFANDPTGRSNEGMVEHQAIRFAFYFTSYGDGCYDDNHGNVYGVDAGMLGCIPYHILQPHFTDDRLLGMGHLHVFEEPVTCRYSDGKIFFGDICIDTDPVDDYDDV